MSGQSDWMSFVREGLEARRRDGAAAAVPFFERAAQLAPNSHVPAFMLGNAASELGCLDEAVTFYRRSIDLQPSDPVIRYNLGLCQFWRGYIGAAVEELGIARQLNPDYLPAQSTYIMALHNHDGT